ncbi:MAG: GTPase HflX [Elusimicrobia bacterium]|nr:GTPase HflX [Elusimicrobiota bacterium]
MKKIRALLISVRLKKDRIRQNSLDELRRLAETANIKVVEETNINIQEYSAATLIGSGKIDELKKFAENANADMVIFDDDISPTQERNLEKKLELRIIDRTYLILEIFSSRAQTYEGKLQVELAKLSYKLTRLSGKGRQFEQQRGLIGARGPGERKLEFEKRVIRKKTNQLKKELEGIKKGRSIRREGRSALPMPQISIVGYTNAGKSTLLDALITSNYTVYSDDKLFATLDTLTKRVKLPSGGYALFTDTVGFIQKLPHSLIAAFRATMEEIAQSDLIIHVHDLSSPFMDKQHIEVEKTLDELRAQNIPRINVYNKIDTVNNLENHKTQLTGFVPVFISAFKKTGLKGLLKKTEEELKGKWKNREIELPIEAAGFMKEIYLSCVAVKTVFKVKKIKLSFKATDENYKRIKLNLRKFKKAVIRSLKLLYN